MSEEIRCPIESDDLGYVPWTKYNQLLSIVKSLLSLEGADELAEGTIRAPRSKYYTEGNAGIDANNSDLIGLNALYFRDVCDASDEGINFQRENGRYDTLKALNGNLLLVQNRLIGDREKEPKVIIEDTGWTEAELTDIFTHFSATRKLRYRRKNGVIYLDGAVTPVSDISGGTGQHIICTLPEGFRPSQLHAVRAQTSDTNTYCLIVSTNGNVTFSRHGTGGTYTTAKAGDVLATCYSFPVD